jgi:hypothetical protein
VQKSLARGAFLPTNRSMRKIANGKNQKVSATMPTLDSTSPTGVRTWIRDVCKSAGVTPTQLARSAGFPPATVNRFLNQTKGAPTNLNAGTIAKLQEAAVRLISPSASAAAQQAPSVGQRWAIRTIEVTGPITNKRRQAAEWTAGERDKYLWPAPIELAYSRYFVVGLEVEDDSVDLLYPVGSILTCVPFSDLGRAPRSGERVVVHQRHDDGTAVTVMEYLIDNNRRAWLIARSSRPDIVNIDLGEHESVLPDGVTIPFRVTGSFIPE